MCMRFCGGESGSKTELNSKTKTCAKHLRQEEICQEQNKTNETKGPLWLEGRVVRDESRKEARAKLGRTSQPC